MQIRHLMALGLFMFVISLQATQTLPTLPVQEYDYHTPENIVSPITLGMGGINLTNAADYFTSYDNPALLASNVATAAAVSFRLDNDTKMTFADMMKTSNLLKDKQFMYYTLITKSAAWTYQPVSSVHESEISSTQSKYYDYQLDKLQLSIATKDENYTKIAGGLSIKYLTGRLIYLQERRSGNNLIRESFIDNKVKGVSGDIGVTWEEDKYVFGLCAYDVLSRLWWESYDSKSLQRRIAGGFQYNMDNLALMASIQSKVSNKPETSYHFGLVKNWTWKSDTGINGETTEQNLIIRAGMFSKDFNGTENINYTLGSGYNYNMFRVDFALTNGGMQLKDSQYLFSVGVGIQ